MLATLSRLSSFLAILSVASPVILAAPAPSPADSAAGALDFLRRQQLSTVYSSCTQPNTVALTFDDGPYIYEQDVVNTLNAAGIKGTFFINGNNWECIYDDSTIASLKSAFNSGHQIGSHTWQHLDLTTLTWDEINNQMWLTQLAMSRILGVYPSFFRPPYGNYNNLVLQAAAERNMTTILWDFDSGDSTGSTVQQSEDAYQTTVNQHPNNILALNHETYNTTVDDVLPYAINLLKSAGYNFVTVAECLGMSEMYWGVTAPGTPDSTWTC